ncbi:MAG: hypothetical protein AAF467_10245 [Actinomycetota bacterium]
MSLKVIAFVAVAAGLGVLAALAVGTGLLAVVEALVFLAVAISVATLPIVLTGS